MDYFYTTCPPFRGYHYLKKNEKTPPIPIDLLGIGPYSVSVRTKGNDMLSLHLTPKACLTIHPTLWYGIDYLNEAGMITLVICCFTFEVTL